MFEHEKYTPVGEDRVMTEFIKEMDRLNGPLWHMEYLGPEAIKWYQETIKNVNEERAIAAQAISKISIATEMFSRHRPMLLSFWRALNNIGIAEVTYTEQETKNMKLWLEHNKSSTH